MTRTKKGPRANGAQKNVSQSSYGKLRGSATANTENVKSHDSRDREKQALSPKPRLNRTTFRTSRESDFFSAKELVTQTGHAVEEWPLVIIKELVDNALDACEEADVSPVIHIAADDVSITVSDNGPGLPDDALRGALDFNVRSSNREAYVAPDRGAQGNALKTLLPMPRVLDPENGKLLIDTGGTRHIITCGFDPISQQAVINDDVADLPKCKNPDRQSGDKASFLDGTTVRVEWAPKGCGDDLVWPFGEMNPLDDSSYRPIKVQVCELVEGFGLFNPHATIRLDWFGETTLWDALDPNWAKWKACHPTSAHWYELAHLERLIGAYVTHDRESGSDRLVSEFVAEFDGLTGSQKRSRVLDDAGFKRVKLSDLVIGGHFDSPRIGALLQAMKRHTRPIKPKALGIIGEEHLRIRLLGMGIAPDSFRYSRKLAKEGLPWVLESAFGYLGACSENRRRIFSGANWSTAIRNPFRFFGQTGEGLEAKLNELKAGRYEPIVFVLHLAHPRIEYTDRGKSALVVSERGHHDD